MNALAPPRLSEGVHPGIGEATYHADPCQEPSVSSGILRLLHQRSPDHARAAHPRLNPNYEPSAATEAMHRGTILHALTLETAHPHRVLDVSDYKSKAAQEQRADTLAAGLIPVKVADMEALLDVAATIRARLRAMPDVWDAMQGAIASGMAEATLIWRERGVLCRCRYDTLPDAHFGASYDLKFTGLTAEPEAFGRKVTGDYAFQADFYPRAVKVLRGDTPLFVFVACETDAPYGITLHALDPEAADLAREKVDAALDLWSECLRSGAWPSYPTLIHYHGTKAWDLTAWDERQTRHRQAREFAAKPSRTAIERSNAFMAKLGATR